MTNRKGLPKKGAAFFWEEERQAEHEGRESAREKRPCRDDGAGSVVVHDIPSNSVAVGNPARVIKTLPASDDK